MTPKEEYWRAMADIAERTMCRLALGYKDPDNCKEYQEWQQLMKVGEPSNWISVKDELPNLEGKYIVAYRKRNQIEIGTAEYMFFDYADGGNNRHEFILQGETITYPVTHWQPLPEPPKQ